jgi:hypothetical protein
VTDGHLPYPYGRETTGYEVTNLNDTVAKAKRSVPTYWQNPTRRMTELQCSSNFPEGTSPKFMRSGNRMAEPTATHQGRT